MDPYVDYEQKNIQFLIGDCRLKTPQPQTPYELYKFVGRDNEEYWRNKDVTHPSNKVVAQALYVNNMITPVSTPTADGNIMIFNSTTQRLDWVQAAPGTYDKLLVDMEIRYIAGTLTTGNVFTWDGTNLRFLPPQPNDHLIINNVVVPIAGGAQIGTRMQYDGANLVFTPYPGTNRIVRSTNTQPLAAYSNISNIVFSLNGGNNGRRKLTITGSSIGFDGISQGTGNNFRVLFKGNPDPLWNGIYYCESIVSGVYTYQLALDAYTMTQMDLISVSDGYLNKGAQFVVTSAPTINTAVIFGRTNIVTGTTIGANGRLTTNTYAGENSGGDNNFISVDVTAAGYDCNNQSDPTRPYTFETTSIGTRAAYNAAGYQCVFLGCDAGNAPTKQVQDFDGNDFMINIGYKSGSGDLPGRQMILVSNWKNDTHPRTVDCTEILSNCEYVSLDPSTTCTNICTSSLIYGGSTDFIAIGTNCIINNAIESVIIGDHTTIDIGSSGAVGIGSYTNVFSQSVAIGSHTTSNINGIAIGRSALTTGGIAIGLNTNSVSGIAVGESSRANLQTTTVIGWTAAAASSGTNTTVLGYNAATTLAAGTGCTLVGSSSNVSIAGATDRIVIGRSMSNITNSTALVGNNSISYLTAGSTGTVVQGLYQICPEVVKASVGTYTITPEEMQPGSVCVSTSQAAGETWTTATAALIIAKLPAATVGSSYLFYLRNEGTFTITLAAGTGVTFGSGVYTVISSRCVVFKITLTSASAVTMQRMMTSNL